MPKEELSIRSCSTRSFQIQKALEGAGLWWKQVDLKARVCQNPGGPTIFSVSTTASGHVKV